MSNDDIDEELSRYIAYLQRLIAGDGPVVAESSQSIAEWIRTARTMFDFGASSTTSSAAVDAYLELARGYHQRNEYDSFHAEQIFQPVLENVRAACRTMAVGPQRSVILANSPALGVTPAARPSADDEHMLFAGAGTFAFCNYWGKAIADLVQLLIEIVGPVRLCDIDLSAVLSSHRHLLLLPVQLAAYFATTDTLLGFGQVTQATTAFAYRMELVRAMEVFVIGHEFGHFILEEHRGTSDTSRDTSVKEEYEADQLGFVICRYFGSAENSWFAYTGAGPLVFFHAFRICEDARELLGGARMSTTHPPTTQRINAIEHFIRTSTHPEEHERVFSFIDEYQALLNALRKAVGAELKVVFDEIRPSTDLV